jgi:Fe-S-cluster containining protein
MRDGPVRRTIKAIARANYFANLRLSRLPGKAKGGPPFELAGACRLCAKCCEAPSVQVGPLVWRLKTLRWAFLAWHRLANQFELVGEEPLQKVFVFRCGHFDPATRRCDSYDSRPGMCRDYPRNLLWHAMPDFFPECGHFAASKKRGRMAELLAAEDIPPEKREAIDRAFYLGGAGMAPPAAAAAPPEKGSAAPGTSPEAARENNEDEGAGPRGGGPPPGG